MAKRKQLDPIAKLIWNHMKYAQGFTHRGIWENGQDTFYTPSSSGIKVVTQSKMQTMCEAHMARTVSKIRKEILFNG